MNTQRIVKTIVMLFLIALLFSTQSEGDITNVFAQSGQSESDYSQEKVEGIFPELRNLKSTEVEDATKYTSSRRSRFLHEHCFGETKKAKRIFNSLTYKRIRMYLNICDFQDIVEGGAGDTDVQDLLCNIVGLHELVGYLCAESYWQGGDDHTEMLNLCSGYNDAGAGIIYDDRYQLYPFGYKRLLGADFVGCQYMPYFYQNVIEKDGTCKTYKFGITHTTTSVLQTLSDLLEINLMDSNGDLSYIETFDDCQIKVPTREELRNVGVSDADPIEVQQYTNWFVRDGKGKQSGVLYEAIWLNYRGFMRETRMNNGFVSEITAEWTYVGEGVSPWEGEGDSISGIDYVSSAQGGFMVNERFHQLVFEPSGNCHRYEGEYQVVDGQKRLIIDPIMEWVYEHSNWVQKPVLDDEGRPIPKDKGCDDAPRSCYTSGGTTTCPNGEGTSSYTAWVHNNTLYEALWNTNVGYMRERDISSNGTINWNTGSWEAMYTSHHANDSSPRGQGGYVLWEPYDP